MTPGNHIDAGRLRARVSERALVVEQPPDWSIRLDAEGRWCSYRRGPVLHRRSLDDDVVVRSGSGVRSVDRSVRGRILEEIESHLRDVRARIQADPGIVSLHGERGTVRDVLDRVERGLTWPAPAYAADRRLFHDAYPEPIGVLPPDRYRDVVVLPAFGCPHGRCYFCTLFPRGGFRVLESAAFERHLERVVELFGDSLATRDGVFLGSASALSLSRSRLMAVLGRVRDVLGRRRRGVAAFHDPDHAPRRAAGDFEALRRAGLRHVTVGLETGLPPLREALGKSGDVEGVIRAVVAQREGGLRSAVTLLVGAGGVGARDLHLRESAAAIAAMSLNADDRVFVSPLEGSLSPMQMGREIDRFRARLGEVTPATVAPYRLERFRYYA